MLLKVIPKWGGYPEDQPAAIDQARSFRLIQKNPHGTGFRLHNSEKICDEKISIEKKKGRSDRRPFFVLWLNSKTTSDYDRRHHHPPRRSPPRSPKPPERLSCGRASFTVRFRPSRSVR